MFMSKEELLEGYLNNAYYGNRAYGVQSASKTYFNKEASQLSLSESALLAGIVSNPTKFDPINHYEEALIRKDHVLELMKNNGIITAEDYELSKDEKVQINFQQQSITAPHFVNHILSQPEKMKDKYNKRSIYIYNNR
jgi:penicillin-binding protein 2A